MIQICHTGIENEKNKLKKLLDRMTLKEMLYNFKLNN